MIISRQESCIEVAEPAKVGWSQPWLLRYGILFLCRNGVLKVSEYPKRNRFFSHRFVRLLTKTAMAQQIGPGACWLLTIVAHQEDSKRYTGPVLYWNEQLMALCGFGSRSRLVTARRKAVEAGWLHYGPGGKGKAGAYWVIIPERFEDLPDLPCDENPSEYLSKTGQDNAQDTVILSKTGQDNAQDTVILSKTGQDNAQDTVILSETGQDNALEAGRQIVGSGTANEHHSTLPPIPNPKEKNKRARAVYPNEFEIWWKVYPRHEAKKTALVAWMKALTDIRTRNGWNVEDARVWLLEVTRAFAASPKGKGDFCPYPATWLNQGRYDDDQSDWKRSGGNNRGGRELGPGEKFDPNSPEEITL